MAPRLAAFAAESLSFTQFYDQTHLGSTSDAEFVSLNSLHPTPVGFVVYRYSSNTFAALALLLRQAGYATASAVGARGDFWNMRRMHKQYGFDASFYDDSYRVDERIGGWLSDRSFFAQTVPRLHDLPRPFFAFLLTSSNHHPYKGDGSSRRLSVGALQGTLPATCFGRIDLPVLGTACRPVVRGDFRRPAAIVGSPGNRQTESANVACITVHPCRSARPQPSPALLVARLAVGTIRADEADAEMWHTA